MTRAFADVRVPLVQAPELSIVPNVWPVTQHLERRFVDDVPAKIASELRRDEIGARLRPGQKVAIAVGSRSIASIVEVVRAVVERVREAGGEPFLCPAMGSHGGGTVKGQVEVLRSLGLTEASVGAPLRATMDTIQLGTLPDGTPLFMDAYAAAADGIIMINRVKPHTQFRGPVESGLSKILVAGLGNIRGISALHARGTERFDTLLPAAVELACAKRPVLFGLALIENAYGQLAEIEAVPAEALVTREAELLVMAHEMMPRLLFDECDVLVLEKVGKDISGPGFDPNVVGRNARTCRVFGGPPVQRLVALSLSDGAHGNAVGMGALDVITAKMLAAIDFEATYANSVASSYVEFGALPIVAKTSGHAVAIAMNAVTGRRPAEVRLIYARSTKHLTQVFVSAPLLDHVNAHPGLELAGAARYLLEGEEVFRFPDQGVG